MIFFEVELISFGRAIGKAWQDQYAQIVLKLKNKNNISEHIREIKKR